MMYNGQSNNVKKSELIRTAYVSPAYVKINNRAKCCVLIEGIILCVISMVMLILVQGKSDRQIELEGLETVKDLFDIGGGFVRIGSLAAHYNPSSEQQ